MKIYSESFSEWALVVAVVAVLFAVAVIAALAVTAGAPGVATLAGVLIVFLVAIMVPLATYSVSRERQDAKRWELDVEGAAASSAGPELELMDMLPDAPLAPFTIGITRAIGVCPLGFRRGDAWFVGSDGHISRQMCRPAITALGSILQATHNAGLDQEVACLCPLIDRQVLFAVQSRD